MGVQWQNENVGTCGRIASSKTVGGNDESMLATGVQVWRVGLLGMTEGRGHEYLDDQRGRINRHRL